MELLCEWFEMQGMIVTAAQLLDFRRGHRDLSQFLADIRPDVIVYDIALPYDVNWQYFQMLLARRDFSQIPVVLTTGNLAALQMLVAGSTAHELVRTPHDLWKLQEVVTQVLMPGPRVRSFR